MIAVPATVGALTVQRTFLCGQSTVTCSHRDETLYIPAMTADIEKCLIKKSNPLCFRHFLAFKEIKLDQKEKSYGVI